jgi:hypothetical protein
MAPRTTPLLILSGLLIGGPAQSGPLLGLSWQPSFNSEALDSGLVVGAFDGLLQPPLSPFFGWRWGAHQLNTTLSVVQFSSKTDPSQWALGTVHIGVDYQRDVKITESGLRIWAGGGFSQLIPLLRDTNDSYSDSEVALSESELSQKKAQLAGTGIRVGLGVEFPIRTDMWVGFHHHLVNQLRFNSAEDSGQINAFVRGESGIHVQVDF